MCGTCGCGEHHHHHDHTHEHSHGHEHHHHPDEGIVINLEQDILQRNNLLAERNRGYFEAKNLFCLNLMSSPGSGKTTLIKILNGLLKPDQGMVTIDGEEPGIHTKSVISYLPDKPYFADWMKISDLMNFFEDFYEDFDRKKAEAMCETLKINTDKKVISLNLQIDTDICSMYEYFEIFLNRMLMCRGAADLLGATFKLTANGAKVL